ncbi:phytanoyl-CoA dioxygenase family protein [Paenibacillus sp. TAB 01]|uniref:phytanoyl-CoA dioxygenase family protein n=1 Tax=Paenibacillus sp. TAB 01 TaxID=3368988 RepID=UPI0037513B1F
MDPADEENGGLMVVPRSNRFAVECPNTADPAVSFTKEEVKVPEGYEAVPAVMEAGDVLFFNGSVIHGSYPNRSADRFRRAFICHYSDADTNRIGKYYKPLYRHDGTEVFLEDNEDAGPMRNRVPGCRSRSLSQRSASCQAGNALRLGDASPSGSRSAGPEGFAAAQSRLIFIRRTRQGQACGSFCPRRLLQAWLRLQAAAKIFSPIFESGNIPVMFLLYTMGKAIKGVLADGS